MEFARPYYNTMDRSYFGQSKDIESPVIGIADLGATVTEGRAGGGTFLQSFQAAIREGAGQVELATQMEGAEPGTGAESYGKEARQELKDLAIANQVRITSIHAPHQIGNLSGFDPQRGFNDEVRKTALEEVKKAIEFASDVGGQAVVVHTGEYQRPFSDQEWNKMGEFRGYDEEATRATVWMVDDRTGHVLGDVKRSQVVYEPVYKTAETNGFVGKVDPKTGHVFRKDDWVDMRGTWLDPTKAEDLFKRVPIWDETRSRFETKRLTWDDFVKRAEEWTIEHPGDKKLPEEMFYKTQLENQMLQARGSSLYHAQFYERYKKDRDRALKALEYYEKLESNIPEDEKWKIMKEMGGELGGLVPPEVKKPSEWLKENINQLEKHLQFTHESSASADAQADLIQEQLKHVLPVNKYAIEQSLKSYAQAGIYAMQQSTEKHLKNDVFVAPEHIFPEMGYGSHPKELIQLVKGAREKMIEFLTEKKISDPEGHRDREGNIIMVENPYFRGISKEQATKEAENHIKATLDTQHLGMWWKYFQPKPGETNEQTRKRFDSWYMDQIKELEKEKILGHVHIVDGFGRGHTHLPAGQGLTPIQSAVEYLMKKGFKGTLVSEGFAEGGRRQLTESWRLFGSPIYGAVGPMRGGSTTKWSDVENSYFGKTQTPYYVFGAYSPSNDWTLWTQVPLE
ncbi:MAG: TIM barrel protein [Candidatus Woesearchaeota archaeon]|nr:TIM barrel protein [Candidatus Woesearchaeota archaeon]